MAKAYLGTSRAKLYVGDAKVKKVYLGSQTIYSADGLATYYVDSSKVYTEEIETDTSCLSPTTFTPSKSGYTFVGWVTSTTSTSALSSLDMTDDGVTLYALFSKSITLTKYDGSSTATTSTGTLYYCCGTVTGATFTLSQKSVSGWTNLGWCTSISATASVVVSDGSSVTLTSDATYYGKYSKTITLTLYDAGSTTATTETGTRYWNSYGDYSGASFTLSQTSVSGWTSYGWSTSSSSVSSVAQSSSATISLSSDATYYAVYRNTVIFKLYNNSTTATSTTKYAYYCYGNTTAATLSLSQSSKSGWSTVGWSTSSSSVNSSYTVTSSATLSETSAGTYTYYGKYKQTVTISYNGNGSTSGSTSSSTGTRYYNSSGVYGNPTITLRSNGFTKTNCSFSKWALSSTSGTQYSAGASFTVSSNSTTSYTFYAIWTVNTKTITSASSLVLTKSSATKSSDNVDSWSTSISNNKMIIKINDGSYGSFNFTATHAFSSLTNYTQAVFTFENTGGSAWTENSQNYGYVQVTFCGDTEQSKLGATVGSTCTVTTTFSGYSSATATIKWHVFLNTSTDMARTFGCTLTKVVFS